MNLPRSFREIGVAALPWLRKYLTLRCVDP
jgi:hypothetical protein